MMRNLRRQAAQSEGEGTMRIMYLASLCVAIAMPAAAHAESTTCDVAIVGGGPGGVHTAYKLTTQHLAHGTVCLFEKRDHLGGRVGDNYDVGFSGTSWVNDGVTVLGSGQTGTGGYRMYNTHYTWTLGHELAALGKPGQLTFVAQDNFNTLTAVANRGYDKRYALPIYFTYDNGGDAPAMQPLYGSPVGGNDWWTTLLCGPQIPTDTSHHPVYRQMSIPGLGNLSTHEYLEWVAANVVAPHQGAAAAQFLLDTYRFRGDFESPIDAISYLEFSAKDFAGGPVFYPVPSFQPYFDIMQEQIARNGGQVFLSEKVLTVNRSREGYVLTTANHRRVVAHTVILAVPQNALMSQDPYSAGRGLHGDVIEDIVRQPEFAAVQDTNAVTVTHQFGDGKTPNSGWWHRDIRYPDGPWRLGPQLGQQDLPLRRTTNDVLIPGERLPGCHHPSCDFSSTLFFNNTNELPLTPYHDFINISRSVYNDERNAVERWIALYEAGDALAPGGGVAAINRQILKSLRLMYPTVFNGYDEPQILATQLTIHRPAWYNLRKGAFGQGVTNDSLAAWALSPLTGERVYLVGDTWRTDTEGWSDAAYKSSIAVLNQFFGAHIDPQDVTPIQCVGNQIVYP
jgi:hypothetical protein